MTMYIVYVTMVMIAAGITYGATAATNIGGHTTSSHQESYADGILSQMHHYHLAAYQVFKDCMESNSCSDGVIEESEVVSHLPDTMADAGAFNSNRFLSFIIADADVSSQADRDGVLVTIWSEGALHDHPYKGRAYAKSRISHSYYTGGRFDRVGSNYSLRILDDLLDDETDDPIRTRDRLNAVVELASSDIPFGVGSNQRPQDFVAFISADVHIY